MKKLSAALSAVGLFLLFVGCQSTPALLAERGPIAVITVNGNQYLPWLEPDNTTATSDDDGEEDGIMATMVNKVFNRTNPEFMTAQDRVDYAADSFLHLLPENTGVEVIDKDVLLNAKVYKNTSESIFNVLDTTIKATGYKNFLQMGSKTARNLMQEVGAKSLIMAEFTFKKTVVSGLKSRGQLGGYVIMKLRYLDEQGRELINHEYTATSADTIPVSNGKYEKDDLVELYPELIETVINQFIVQNL